METPHTPSKAIKRKHSAAFKRKLVALTQQPGASVAAIALEHVNANMVFKWRTQLLGRPTSAKPVAQAILLPVTIDLLPSSSYTTS